MSNTYDITIIGGGPAGLTAGIYSARAGMKTVLLEKMIPGGQVLMADLIENFPGFPGGTNGQELAGLMLKQAEAAGLEISTREAKRIILKEREEDPFTIETAEGDIFTSFSIIVSTGASWNVLGVPGEDKLKGRGVSYCATCDGPLFKNKDVVVVGGGDTALGEAIFLTRFANKVTVVHRRDRLRAARIIQDRAFANKRIEFCMESVAVEIIGTAKVEGIKVRNVATNEAKIIKADGVFVLIGLSPNSGIFKGLLKLDKKGYIESDEDMRTSVDGIFVCGDVRKKLLRQIVTAAGEGAVAAVSAGHYVEKLKGAAYE